MHQPLIAWAAFTWGHDLFSYALLIPAVSGYLYWIHDAGPVKLLPGRLFPHLALWVAATGAGWMAGFPPTPSGAKQDWLSLWMAVATTIALLHLLLLCGWAQLRARLFPSLFLFFCIPFPTAVETFAETLLQRTSAEAAALFFTGTGMVYFRDDLVFQLPGISLEVAPECSGIHSSLVLLVVSFVAGYLFLSSPWRRLIFILAVIPLGIIRNGFRVWTLGTLCVYDDPSWINSPLHHRGGPLFFALSLIPFSLLLWLLYKQERKDRSGQNSSVKSS
ncbi:exosortase [Nibricoccus sp. IMCC34717]|uniref:exosortase n=1 Tax=Nibricoccus sp. IMCC34717 TaxID=3034021 RepID=UPI003850750D